MTAWWTSLVPDRATPTRWPNLLPVHGDQRQPSPVVRLALGLGALALLAAGLHTLVGLTTGPDLIVYWKGGWVVLHGKSLYGHEFVNAGVVRPYLFTYTPFAALIFAPMALLTLPVLMVLWTAAEVTALYVLVRLAFARRLAALSRRQAVAASVLLWSVCLILQPIQDGVLLGQVDIFLTLACFADMVLTRTRWPRGVLLGLATAVKLTPGVFLVHLALTRQWRVLRNALLTLAACWGTAFALLPRASVDFFFRGVMFDTGRVGDAALAINQSINGMVLRLGLPHPTLCWAALCVPVLAVGLTRAATAYRAGQRETEAVLVAVVMLLVSPISWLHHAAWVVPLVALLVTSAKRGLVAAGAVLVVFLLYVAPTQHGVLSEWYVETYLLVLLALPVGERRITRRRAGSPRTT